IASMLFFAKDLRRMLDGQHARRWDPFDVVMLKGRTLGIIGYGGIGRATAKLARAMGMRIVAGRRRAGGDEEGIDAIYAPDRLREMLGLCDFVFLATPLTPETRGMIGPGEIAAMKESAVFINVGRGAVVVESALVEALEKKRILGASLDVFEQEPLPPDHPFYRLPNVLLSPHCADRAAGWQQVAMRVFLDNLERYRRGEPLHNVVDKKAGY